MDFGKQIKEARTKRNITQLQLATMSNTSQSALAAYENNSKTPKFETLERIAAALEINVLSLLPSDLTKGTVILSTSEEKELFKIVSDLNETGQRKVLDYANDICINPKYRK